MKTTVTLYICIMALALVGGCTDHSLSVENDCQIPTSLMTAKEGSFWIYQRTQLDTLGNPIGDPSMSAKLQIYDTLTLLGRDAAYSYQGVTALMLEDRYSEDYGLTFRKDTVYWVMTPDAMYVNTTAMQRQSCECPSSTLLRWRRYENCAETYKIYADTLYQGDTYPSMKTDSLGNSVVFTKSILVGIKNFTKMIASEKMTVNGKSIATKKSQSYLGLWNTFNSPTPEDVTFLNGKKTIGVYDDRTVWTNRDIGIVKERSIVSNDGNLWDTPRGFERMLIRYSIVR